MDLKTIPVVVISVAGTMVSPVFADEVPQMVAPAQEVHGMGYLRLGWAARPLRASRGALGGALGGRFSYGPVGVDASILDVTFGDEAPGEGVISGALLRVMGLWLLHPRAAYTPYFGAGFELMGSKGRWSATGSTSERALTP